MGILISGETNDITIDVVTVLGTMSKADFVAKYKEIYDNRTAARAVVGGE